MFTYSSVNFTYSYNQGYAKYLITARKLSSRFFISPYSPPVLGGVRIAGGG